MADPRENHDPTIGEGDSIYRQILEAAGKLILVLNQDGTIVEVSSGMADFLGISVSEILDKSARTILSDTALRQIQMRRETSLPRTVHTVLRLQNGQTVVRMVCQVAHTSSGEQIHCLIEPHKPAPPRIDPLTGANSLYHLLARNLPETAVILFDQMLQIQIAEGPALQQFLPAYQHLEGENICDIFAGIEQEQRDLVQQCLNVLKGNESFLEQRHNALYFSIHVIPVRTSGNGITGGLIVAQNINARKESEQALHTSEIRNRTLLNALPDNLLVVQRDGMIKEVHTNAETAISWIHGIQPGMPLQEVALPADTIQDALLYVRIALTTRQIQSFTLSRSTGMHAENEAGIYYEVRMLALNEHEVLILLRDMTAFKRVQDELHRHIEDLTIVRQVNAELADRLNFTYVVQLALDAALRLSKADAGFLALLQQDGSLDLVHLIGAYDVKTLRKSLREPAGVIAHVLESQKPELIQDTSTDPVYAPALKDTRAIMVIPLVSNNSRVGILYLETRIANRFNRDQFQFLQLITGRIAAYLDNARLYYQTQEQLEQLQKLYAEVAQLEQLKTDMIRIASHDLKNPLAWILGYLDFLRMDLENLNDQQKTYLNNIEQAARKMQTLTSSILSLERIEHMAQEHTREELDMVGLLNRCIMEQMEQVVANHQTVNRDLPADPIKLIGDAIQLHEALTNLIANAIKYTPESGTIIVSLRQIENTVQIRITDTGYGIPDEMHSRIFTPFFRVVTKETRNIEGTGLGLHLVKNIIERHQGKLFFESTYGKGSTFGFDLPLHPPVADDALRGSLILDR